MQMLSTIYLLSMIMFKQGNTLFLIVFAPLIKLYIDIYMYTYRHATVRMNSSVKIKDSSIILFRYFGK